MVADEQVATAPGSIGNGATLQAEDLSAGGFERLQAAVNTATEYQCQSITSLRARLVFRWPNRSEDINETIFFWANDDRTR